MFLALKEMRRAKVRFGLLAGAVGLLVFLILFQQALLTGLINQFIGALKNQSGEVLVYNGQARKNLEGSIILPDQQAAIAEVEGVAVASPFGQATFSVGMKLMALVMIARIGSEVLISLANSPSGADEFLSTLAIGGISVVVFVIAMYVPNIIQGMVQGVSVTVGPQQKSMQHAPFKLSDLFKVMQEATGLLGPAFTFHPEDVPGVTTTTSVSACSPCTSAGSNASLSM